MQLSQSSFSFLVFFWYFQGYFTDLHHFSLCQPIWFLFVCLFSPLILKAPAFAMLHIRCGINAPVGWAGRASEQPHLPSTQTATLCLAHGQTSSLLLYISFHLQFHLFNRLGFLRAPCINQDSFDYKIQKAKSSSLRQKQKLPPRFQGRIGSLKIGGQEYN